MEILREDPFGKIYELCDTGLMADKIKHLPSFPRYLDVELTNTCNFCCTMCPTGRGVGSRPEGFMSLDIFELILKECIKERCYIRFVRWGEPLLHPFLLTFIEKIIKAGLLCHINTNGFYANETFLKRIVKIPLSSLKFSMQGLDKKDYEKIRVGGDYDKLLVSIKTLYELRGHKTLPFIMIGTTIQNEPQKKINDFKKRMGKICDKVTIGKTREIIKPAQKTNFPECCEMFDKLSIDWDGFVTGCCSDWDRFLTVGDIKEDSLKRIWANEKMALKRYMLATKQHHLLPLCSGCNV